MSGEASQVLDQLVMSEDTMEPFVPMLPEVKPHVDLPKSAVTLPSSRLRRSTVPVEALRAKRWIGAGVICGYGVGATEYAEAKALNALKATKTSNALKETMLSQVLNRYTSKSSPA